tara:strand:+ start:12 stop:203 length:192 start_codon:yes stop_codon:yes gene_type:complete
MKEKQLKDRLKMIGLSPKAEPVLMGEITLAMNVLERVKYQNPGLYSRVLEQLDAAEGSPATDK